MSSTVTFGVGFHFGHAAGLSTVDDTRFDSNQEWNENTTQYSFVLVVTHSSAFNARIYKNNKEMWYRQFSFTKFQFYSSIISLFYKISKKFQMKSQLSRVCFTEGLNIYTITTLYFRETIHNERSVLQIAFPSSSLIHS